MAGYFILSTRKGDYRALAFQGSQVYACHAQLSGLLRTHLGEAHARLLAEPLMDPQGTAVDWYTSGPVQPLAELPAETQEAVKTRLQGLLSDIEELAASLQTDSDPYKSLCGTMLHLATRFPTQECLYASLPSGEPASPPQPVLVCWGMALSSSTAQEGIYAMGATPFSPEPQTPLASGASGDPDRIVREGEVTERPIVAPLPPTVVVEGEPWWKKLLMLLLGLLLALLLFWGLHFLFPWVPPLPLPAGCARTPAVETPQPAVQPADPGLSEADLTALRAELEVLRQAAQKRADEIIGGADFPRQLLRHTGVADVGAVHVHRGAVDGAHIGAQLLQNIQNQCHVADLGDVLNAAGAVHQQGGGNNGDGGVLCAADGHFAKQRMAAMDHVFVQGSSLFSDGQ